MSAEKWFFPTIEGNMKMGMSASGSESFKDNPMRSLAREICQNSYDNRIHNGQPAEVDFELYDVNVEDIPGFDELKKTFQLAYKSAVEQKSEEGQEFFSVAVKESSKKQVKCLVIRDFNTTGLTGSDKAEGTCWSGLVYSVGMSPKSGTAGGSKGLGKMAAFLTSDFSTVFYSTYDENNVEAAMGISRLSSYTTEDGKNTIGIGSYGIDGIWPIKRQLLPSNVKVRDIATSGTDVIIYGFNGGNDWKQTMVFSIIDGFFYTINRGDLRVIVDDVVIDQESLPKIIKENEGKFPDKTDIYYKVLKEESDKAKVFTRDIDGLGEAKLKMMITPGFHRKVACLRSTGMKIMDRTGINGYVPFAGIFYAEGEDLNIFLRELENPEHTNWSDTRPKTKEKKARAKKVLLEILHFMKESLDAMRLIETGKAINLSLGNYLADEGDEKDDQQKQEGINDEITSIIFKQINIAEKKTDEGQEGSGETAQVAEDAEEGDHKKTDVNGGGGTPNDTQGGTGGGSGGSGEGKVPAYEEAEPGKGNKKLVQIPATRTRFICKDKENGVYRLVYVPKISAHDVKLNLFLSAETQNYDAELLSVRCDKYPEAKIAGNIVEGVEFVAGEPLIIEVGINHHDYCSLEVKASGYTS